MGRLGALVLLLLVVLGGEARGAEQPVGAQLCAVAAASVASADPQRALEIIDAAREVAEQPLLCSSERRDAQLAAVTAGRLHAQARAAAEASEWRQVKSLAEEALALDETLIGAKALVKQAGAELGGASPLSRDGMTSAESRWQSLVKDYLKPLGTLVLAASVVMLGLVALARLLLVFPWGGVISGSTRKERTFANVAGLIALPVTGVVTVWVGPGLINSGDSVDVLAVLGLILLAALTVGLLAFSLATRLRLSISVRDAAGAKDPVGTTQLVAFLRELGADAPAGLQVPQGTDVDILDGKSIVEQTAGWAATALRVLQGVAGFTPWSVVVDEKDGVVHVVVTRNGRSFDSAVVSTDGYEVELSAADTRKMAAAFVLVTLSKGYHPADFAGLAGATEWRSVGLHYVGTTAPPRLDRAAKHRLFQEAVRLDPQNLSAQVAMQHARFHASEDPGELRSFSLWLWRAARAIDPEYGGPVPPGLEGLRKHRDALAVLRLRLLYSATAIALNCRALQPTTELPVAYLGRALLRQLDVVEPRQRAPRLTLLAGHLALHAVRGRDDVTDLRAWRILSGPLDLGSPEKEYNEAAGRAEGGLDEDKAKDILAMLDRAVLTDSDRAWLSTDPSFKALRDRPEYREVYEPKPRGSMLDVPPFVDHAVLLRAMLITSPEQLLRTRLNAGEIAAALGVHPHTVHAMRDVVRLAEAMPEPLRLYRWEVASVLHARGLRPETLNRLTEDERTTLAEHVTEAVAKTGCGAPDEAALRDWFESLHDQAVP